MTESEIQKKFPLHATQFYVKLKYSQWKFMNGIYFPIICTPKRV